MIRKIFKGIGIAALIYAGLAVVSEIWIGYELDHEGPYAHGMGNETGPMENHDIDDEEDNR